MVITDDEKGGENEIEINKRKKQKIYAPKTIIQYVSIDQE
jgi:hypothetical protein